MGGAIIDVGNRRIVHKVVVDEKKLEQIADLLGITDRALRREILSGAQSISIHVGPRPRATRGRRRQPG